ncbi:hypothetical protein D3C75_685160 [compost metagenome]
MQDRIVELIIRDLRQRRLADPVQIALQIAADQKQVAPGAGDTAVHRFLAQHPIGNERQRGNDQDNNDREQQDQLIGQTP